MRERGDDVLDRRLCGKLDGCLGKPQAFCAQPHLRDRLFAGNIDGTLTAARISGCDLDQKGRFADAGVAAEQQHRATDQPAAGHAIKLGDA